MDLTIGFTKFNVNLHVAPLDYPLQCIILNFRVLADLFVYLLHLCGFVC